MLKKIQYLLFTIVFLVLYFKMSELDPFRLTVDEKNLSSFYLWKLKKTFLNHPGNERVELKVIDNHGTFKLLELKSIKVETCINLYLDLLEMI